MKGADNADGDIDDNESVKNFSDELSVKLISIVDGKVMTSVMSILTIFVLWGDDFRLSAFRKEHDNYIFGIFFCSLILFMGEFCVNTVAKANYKWSFFFWLDFIAGISIAPDIPWIIDFVSAITSGDATSKSQANSVASSVDSARTARIVRLVRLIRLIRIVKLYSMMRKASNEKSEEKLRAQALAAQNAKQAALKRLEASRLGKVLSEMTTRRVVVMVLMMLFITPYLKFEDIDTSKQFGLSQIFWYGRSDCADSGFGCTLQHGTWMSESGWDNLIYLYSQVQKDHTRRDAVADTDSLLWLYAPNLRRGNKLESITRVESDFGTWIEDPTCNGTQVPVDCRFRDSDLMTIAFQPYECMEPADAGCNQIQVFARFDNTSRNINAANFRMISTLGVCILLGSMSIRFQNDTQTLVIAPIENMVNIIKQLAVDPLKDPELLQDDGRRGTDYDSEPQMEATMLESTILKIGRLLQVGFGKSGAAIIGKNMSSGDGELNIMMPGTRIWAIFGFVDIHRFAEITMVLQHRITIYSNTVASILHQCVHRWGGTSNTNLGGGFLLVWKLDGVNAEMKFGTGSTTEKTGKLANNALLAFLKFIIECRRSPQLEEYKENPKMNEILGAEHALQCGLGLHAGWAIEGPIGSDFKVDASYISPDINLTVHLQAVSKIYDCPLVLSEKFYNMLSVRMKDRIRKIDLVMFPGTAKMQGVYVYPINDGVLPAPDDHVVGDIIKIDGIEIDTSAIEENGSEYLFIVDADVVQIQQGLIENVAIEYRQAFAYYVSGEWAEAKIYLDKALKLHPSDGPSCKLSEFMGTYAYDSPMDWSGYRSLDLL